MIDFIFVLLAFNGSVQCPETKLVGWADESKMTKQDRASYDTAKTGCTRHFPKSPCLVEFRIKEPGNYYAICGKGN